MPVSVERQEAKQRLRTAAEYSEVRCHDRHAVAAAAWQAAQRTFMLFSEKHWLPSVMARLLLEMGRSSLGW